MMSRENDPSWSEEDDRLAPERPVGRRRSPAKRIDGVILLGMRAGISTKASRTLAKNLVRNRAATAEVLSFSVANMEGERHKHRFILISGDHDTLERIAHMKSKVPLFSSIRRFQTRAEAVRGIVAQFRAQKLKFKVASPKPNRQAETRVIRKRAREM